MMWSSIENLKENLNRIAFEIHEDDDEDDAHLSMPHNSGDSVDSLIVSPANRRISRNLSHSESPIYNYHSPVANGLDSAYKTELEKYKAEIKRLKESEAEIKALSVNYAALLKEKEDHIGRLSKENSSLKQNLQTSHTPTVPRHSSKGSIDQLSNSHRKILACKNIEGNPSSNGLFPQHDGLSNGESLGSEKELADLLEEKSMSLVSMQASYELQIKQLGIELDKERCKLENIEMKLKEEQKLSASFQQELRSLKVDKEKMAQEVARINDEMNQKVAEIQQHELNLHNRDTKLAEKELEDFKRVVAALREENNKLKNDKDKLEASLEASKLLTVQAPSSGGEGQSSPVFPEKEVMEKSLQKLENDLKETRRERDKALLELNRLKQHLLEKESEESEKMDEDTKVIEELRQICESQHAQILQLEKDLKQANGSLNEVKIRTDRELVKSKETVDELNRKLASCLSTIDAKSIEVLNLQTALGQYYAEIEAKERLAEDLTAVKEESARLSALLKDAYERSENLSRDKEEALVKLSEAEKKFADWKNRMNKLEQDNEKLRRALEHSLTRINRMSLDSDNYVDRRIVVKLLVTYFQRNHSKEVLDLMVRMLGFSEEDKQRLGGIGRQGGSGGKGVVRGVFGLPGRLVGGILGGGGGGSSPTAANMTSSDDQSFGDLWVDFLLKETEEREKREAAASNSSFSSSSPSGSFHQAAIAAEQNSSDSEFSTVPLTSAESNYPHSQFSRPLQKY
ncbi:unnamed protein product [Cuscuta epithymum]|uniref:Golgin candidate 4 n=1 Tax=Cuscuta epithymum TaxID=186058 RepID=A0AAV0DCH9_9ASTE|nr:unnamed protein product [Cuscuta epithymum]